MPILGITSSTPAKEIFLAKSQTWTAPFSGQALVTVVGGGGQGGARGYATNNPTLIALGGGAGGCAQSVLNIVGGVGYTVTIGAGGRNSTLQTPTTYSDGTSGGNSSFAGTGVTTMTANGGTGGKHGYASTGNPATVALATSAAAGGSASGGNVFNATGGAGGLVTTPFGGGNVTSVTGVIATGGGAVGLLGSTGGRGGNITLELTGSCEIAFSTGGGGASQDGGDITSVGRTGNQMGCSGGGKGWADDIDTADQPPDPSGGHGMSYGIFSQNFNSTKYYYPSTRYATDHTVGRNIDTYSLDGVLPFGSASTTSNNIPSIGGYLDCNWGYPGYGISDANASVAAGNSYGHNGGGGASTGGTGGNFNCRGGQSYGMGGGGGCAGHDNTGNALSYAGTSKFGGGSGGITFDTDQQPYGTWSGGGPGLVLVQYLTIEA